MNSKNITKPENTSTPKRRRLGTGRILKPNLRLNVQEKELFKSSCSPIHRKITSTLQSSFSLCGSPPLPSNQDEYLNDSRNNNSVCLPASPAVFEDSQHSNDHWESMTTSTVNELCSNHISTQDIMHEIEDISDDMFHSRLEHEGSQIASEEKSSENNENKPPVLPAEKQDISISSKLSKCDLSLAGGIVILGKKSDLVTHQPMDMAVAKCFKEDVEESFELINQSICAFEDDKSKKTDKSSLFETKDSFLLDIKESGIIAQQANNFSNFVRPATPVKVICDNTFYGLPIITKSLFKTYRNIDKFYDWQEECLNLEAIKERRNLIYALPTSGGKTLVAEVLMMREVLGRRKNALFILPFVAIVQEKIWALSPFALKLDFLVEEYTGGKGHIPPKKRRKKNSIYIATIEKGLSLLRSLIELDRLHELGLIVVDELHLIGEEGRGGTLEILLTTAIFASKDIQIVGMSATIGNLPQLADFLRAEVFERQFRPVELTEYVKLGNMLHRLVWEADGLQLVPERQLAYDYSSAATSLDPDWLGGLVSEVVPESSCLVFCATKKNCENVASLLCKLQRRDMTNHRTKERVALERALRAEGADSELVRFVRFGVAYHHAGLASDERALLEQAFRSGVVSVLCCTSTLAAGVNLPARRVLVRAPRLGRAFVTLAAYRQMVGRAGRAGVCQQGESIIMCDARDWEQLRAVLAGGLGAASSQLRPSLPSLLLSAAAMRLATTLAQLIGLMDSTLLARSSEVDLKEVCVESIKSLIQSGAMKAVNKNKEPDADNENCHICDDTELVVSKLGVAAIQSGMDLETAKQFLEDLKAASRGLVLIDSLHLLYIVTPHDATGVKPDYRNYYSLYDNLDEEGIQTAKLLGITENNAIKMMTGKPIKNVPEIVLCRFYLALMLRDMWRQVPFAEVAGKYGVPRGTVQAVLASASSLASCGQRLCTALSLGWFPALLAELASRLQHCAAPELAQLVQLPAVRKSRAMQLMRAGYKRIEDIAKASVDDLVSSVDHLSKTAATHLVSAARMMLIEKVENLRAEAEDVMEDLV